MEVKSEHEAIAPSSAPATAVASAPASSSGSTANNDSAPSSSSGTAAPAKASAPEESESLDLIMVVTNETIDEDSVVGKDKDNAGANTSRGAAASANNPEGGVASVNTASLDTSERLENKTPRASGSASKGGFDAHAADGADKEDRCVVISLIAIVRIRIC